MMQNPAQVASSQQRNSGALFQAYLATHQLSIVDVAVMARVRLMTVWNILHGIPVRQTHAVQVRVAVGRLTGQSYRGTIVMRTEQNYEKKTALHRLWREQRV